MHWSRQLHQTTQWHHITLERVFALSQPPKFWLFFLFACIKISVRKNYLMQHVKNPVLPWPGDGTKHYWWMVHKKEKREKCDVSKNKRTDERMSPNFSKKWSNWVEKEIRKIWVWVGIEAKSFGMRDTHISSSQLRFNGTSQSKVDSVNALWPFTLKCLTCTEA